VSLRGAMGSHLQLSCNLFEQGTHQLRPHDCHGSLDPCSNGTLTWNMLDCRLRSHARSRGIWATGGCGTDCLHTARISGRPSKREETKASHGPCSVRTLVRHEAVFIPAAEDPRSLLGEGMYYLWAPCSAAQREMLSHSPLSIVGRRQWFLSHDDP
jgi:hypothetical protein